MNLPILLELFMVKPNDCQFVLPSAFIALKSRYPLSYYYRRGIALHFQATFHLISGRGTETSKDDRKEEETINSHTDVSGTERPDIAGAAWVCP